MPVYTVIVKIQPSIITGKVGHAFLTFGSTGTKDVTFGFYPMEEGAPVAPGTLRDDTVSGRNPRTGVVQPHPYDSSMTFQVSEKQFSDMLSYSAKVANDPNDVYNSFPGIGPLLDPALRPLVGSGSNVCTDFVRNTLIVGGITPTFGNLESTLLPQSLLPQYFMQNADQRQYEGTYQPGSYSGTINSSIEQIFIGIKKYDPTYTTGPLKPPAPFPMPDFINDPETERLRIDAERIQNISVGLAPDGAALNTMVGDAAHGGATIWLRNPDGTFLLITGQVSSDGSRISGELRYDTRGNFVTAKTYLTDPAGNTKVYFSTTDPSGSVSVASSPLSRDPDYVGGNYTVQKGDSLKKIADDFDLDLQDLRNANPQITHPALINIGQRINIPAPAATNNAFSVTITPIPQPIQSGAIDPTAAAAQVGQGVVLQGGSYSVTTDGNKLNSNQTAATIVNSSVVRVSIENTAIGTSLSVLSGEFRPGNNNLLGDVIDSTLGLQLTGGLGLQLPSNAQFGAILNRNSILARFAFPIDPLVLDLNGDGVKLTDYGSAPVLFDVDNDGRVEQTGWVDRNDGLVVIDRNGNGKIDDISETLSEYYGGPAGSNGDAGTKPFANGIAALKSLDATGDNVFNSADPAFATVRVWIDANHDGKSFIDADNNGALDTGEVSELKTLAQLGITAIDLHGTDQSGLVRGGNEVLATTTFSQNVNANGQGVPTGTTGSLSATREALAANFLANPNGSVFAASGQGTVVTTEDNSPGQSIAAYVSAFDPTFEGTQPKATRGETIDLNAGTVATPTAAGGVSTNNLPTGAARPINVYGSIGDDTLIGDANNNWLVGGPGSDTFKRRRWRRCAAHRCQRLAGEHPWRLRYGYRARHRRSGRRVEPRASRDRNRGRQSRRGRLRRRWAQLGVHFGWRWR